MPAGVSPELPPGVCAGARPSPNIWQHPAIYEIENRAVDRSGVLTAALSALASWRDRDVLDLGCGTGFHLPFFAESARSATGVEPHPDLVSIARRRVRRLPNVSVLQGSATDLPLPPASVDVLHARWAYFFGPGCEPGLDEIDRVMRRGGTAFVIDNDPTRSTFGSWFRRGYPEVDPVVVAHFWTARGWTRHPLLIAWTFDDRADFEAVVGIEFDPTVAAEIIGEHEGTSVDYAINLWVKGF